MQTRPCRIMAEEDSRPLRKTKIKKRWHISILTTYAEHLEHPNDAIHSPGRDSLSSSAAASAAASLLSSRECQAARHCSDEERRSNYRRGKEARAGSFVYRT